MDGSAEPTADYGGTEPEHGRPPDSVGDSLTDLVDAYRASAAATADLAVAEARLASASLFRMATLALFVALFAASAWLLAMLALAVLLADLIGWPAALASLAAANVAAAVGCRSWLGSLRPALGFPELRAALSGSRAGA